jgi:hypothetical protein
MKSISEHERYKKGFIPWDENKNTLKLSRVDSWSHFYHKPYEEDWREAYNKALERVWKYQDE